MRDEGGILHSLPPYQIPECNRKVLNRPLGRPFSSFHQQTKISKSAMSCLCRPTKHPKEAERMRKIKAFVRKNGPAAFRQRQSRRTGETQSATSLRTHTELAADHANSR